MVEKLLPLILPGLIAATLGPLIAWALTKFDPAAAAMNRTEHRLKRLALLDKLRQIRSSDPRVTPNLDWCVLEQEVAAILAELGREQQRVAREDAAARSGVAGGGTRRLTILRTFLVWDRPKSAPDWAGGIFFYYLLLVSVATLAWTIWRLVTGRSDLAIIWFLSFVLYGASAVFLRWMYYRRQQRDAADRVAAADGSKS